jgi:hypothetical protein
MQDEGELKTILLTNFIVWIARSAYIPVFIADVEIDGSTSHVQHFFGWPVKAITQEAALLYNHPTMTKSPTKVIAAKAKPPSPAKRKGKQLSLKDKLSKRTAVGPTLTMYAMHDITNTEVVLYTSGQADGFLATYKKYCDGLHRCDALESANFTGCFYRRLPNSADTIMKNPKGFWRMIIVRHPLDGVSTTETRAEGLAVLKKCFLSSEFSKFPPDDIETIDATDVDNPHALDLFFQDHDIVNIIKEQLDDAVLNDTFYATYTECATKLWSGTFYPSYARGLGFP